MSIPVALDELRTVIDGQAPFAYLLTVSDDARSHAVAIRPAFDGGDLVCEAGRHTCANATSRPGVSLLWPPATADDYSLIVDGIARVDGSTVRITPAKAIRHRPAPGGGNDCITVPVP